MKKDKVSLDYWTLDIETNKIYDEDNDLWNSEIFSVQVMHVSYTDREKFINFINHYNDTLNFSYDSFSPDYFHFVDLIEAVEFIEDFNNDGLEKIVYIHNLSFEGEFILRYLDAVVHTITTRTTKNGVTYKDYFAIDAHSILRLCIDNQIIFKCSYKLTNKSLKSCGYDVGISKGEDFSYNTYHEKGKETITEQLYEYKDVLIVMAKIVQMEKMHSEYDNHTKFPMTSTGFVREYVRNECFKNKGFRQKYVLNSKLTAKEFIMCKRAFMGGDTSTNVNYISKWIDNVDTYDIGSDYPFQMVSKEYPTGKCYTLYKPNFKKINRLLKDGYLCVMSVTFKSIKTKYPYMILSSSKCDYERSTTVIVNGRVESADELTTTCTVVDFYDYLQFYNIGQVRFNNVIYWRKEKLPLPIRQSVIKFYTDKQKLKTIADLSEENALNYLKSKESVNSCYGMMVQNPLNDIIDFNFSSYEWEVTKIDYSNINSIQEGLNRYYKNFKSFLCYQWGIFVTAYARHQLHTAIKNNINYLIYSDTDSCKVQDRDGKCKEWFINYNNTKILPQIKIICEELNVDYELIKDLGSFDYESRKPSKFYKHFKTLGAKKYAYITGEDKVGLTVSGLSKHAADYIKDYNELQKVFIPNTIFDSVISGRAVSHYCNNSIISYGAGGVCIENTTYTLGMTDELLDYIQSLGTDIDKPVTQVVVSKDGIKERETTYHKMIDEEFKQLMSSAINIKN